MSQTSSQNIVEILGNFDSLSRWCVSISVLHMKSFILLLQEWGHSNTESSWKTWIL